MYKVQVTLLNVVGTVFARGYGLNQKSVDRAFQAALGQAYAVYMRENAQDRYVMTDMLDMCQNITVFKDGKVVAERTRWNSWSRTEDGHHRELGTMEEQRAHNSRWIW